MKYVFHHIRVWLGILLFRLSGKTPVAAHRSMISLFCSTRGKTNRAIAKQLALPTCRFPHEGILTPVCFDGRDVLLELETKGQVIFPALVAPDICDLITSHLLQCTGRYVGDTFTATASQVNTYDRRKPLAAKFDITKHALLESDHVQRFICDYSLLTLSQAYLGSGPVIDSVAAWWSASTKGGPDSAAAQFFHFDMDRPRWLKVFLYLTDVTATNGPHVFITGSHRDGGIPKELLSRGYSRLQDQEIEQYFPRSTWIEATGPKGTVIIEDTRGLHKGKQLQSGDRLVLEVEYASSLFGAARPVIEYAPALSPTLQPIISKFPTVFEAFVPHPYP